MSALEERLRETLRAVASQTAVPEVPEVERNARPTAGALWSRRKVRRSAVGIGAAVAVLSTAAAGWAVLGGRSTDTQTEVVCPRGGIMDASTGDPIADCAAEWRRLSGSGPVPPLVAYDDGLSVVVVEGQTPPANGRRLDPGEQLDVRQVELESALEDYVDGLSSRCSDSAAGETFVRSTFDRLGLAGWTVSSRSVADGRATCASFVGRDGAAKRVTLAATELLDATHPYAVMSARLRHAFDARCLSLREAETAVAAAARSVSLPDDEVRVTSLVDPAASCTRIDVALGGLFFVTLRGPT